MQTQNQYSTLYRTQTTVTPFMEINFSTSAHILAMQICLTLITLEDKYTLTKNRDEYISQSL